MSIGYACLCLGCPGEGFKTCTLKSISEDRLRMLCGHNLSVLERILDYNIKTGIRLFRISSDLIPFGSSPLNKLPWQDIFAPELRRLGEKVKNSGMRVSMHPGQYTVLNAKDRDIVQRAIEDLRYHNQVLDSLGTGGQHKIVLHVGGIYGDMQSAVQRFASAFRELEDGIRQRLVIENDDKCYTIGDVLELGTMLGIPVIYDILHNAVNPCDTSKDDYFWIEACRATWKTADGAPKIHYSQQEPLKKPGWHSATIRAREFSEFYNGLSGKKPDIMLEVKDKNLSAVKCINCANDDGKIKDLEREWGRYKYAVLENAPEIYQEIRQMLRDKTAYPVVCFYELIEKALDRVPTVGDSVNAALHVWGYFKDKADEKEKKSFLRQIEALQNGRVSAQAVRRSLLKLAEKYQERYLLDSLYFYLG